MRFFTPLILFAVTSLAAVTPEAIVQALNKFESDAETLQTTAKQVGPVDIILLPQNKGPLAKVVQGFHAALAFGDQVGALLPNTSAITNVDDANHIRDAYTGFAEAHQILFDTLTQRGAFFQYLPNKCEIGKPVYTVLQSVQGLIDGVSGFLVSTIEVPAVTNNISNQLVTLDKSLTKCITNYQGFSL
ncbi:hypothetical protein F5Y15DRAFT_423583 [Xylariaceae sp. FL0016]|nr:hypothetical protein F5Y15DRAFT_423583 [Xylariaceae sp. FL0016]